MNPKQSHNWEIPTIHQWWRVLCPWLFTSVCDWKIQCTRSKMVKQYDTQWVMPYFNQTIIVYMFQSWRWIHWIRLALKLRMMLNNLEVPACIHGTWYVEYPPTPKDGTRHVRETLISCKHCTNWMQWQGAGGGVGTFPLWQSPLPCPSVRVLMSTPVLRSWFLKLPGSPRAITKWQSNYWWLQLPPCSQNWIQNGA